MNLITKTIPKKGTNRVICTQWSESNQEYVPVRIQTRLDGSIYLFSPLGDHHKKAIDKASGILKGKGYKVTRVNVTAVSYEVVWSGRKKKSIS